MGQSSDPITISFTSSGSPYVLTQELPVTLITDVPDGAFSVSNTTWSSVRSVLVPAGVSQMTVYYRTFATGKNSITARANGMLTPTPLVLNARNRIDVTSGNGNTIYVGQLSSRIGIALIDPRTNTASRSK